MRLFIHNVNIYTCLLLLRMYQMDAKEMADKLKEDVSCYTVLVLFLWVKIWALLYTDCDVFCTVKVLLHTRSLQSHNHTFSSSQPNYVPSLEDEIEAQRQAKVEELRKSGKKGTPVTEKSFKEWQERKRKKRAAEAKKLVETELKKKKGGKGLAVLSGRDLFEYKRDLFKDDEEALDQIEEEEMNGAADVENVAQKVQSDLFLEGDDDDLDDIEDDWKYAMLVGTIHILRRKKTMKQTREEAWKIRHRKWQSLSLTYLR